jgi:hypothetical protein
LQFTVVVPLWTCFFVFLLICFRSLGRGLLHLYVVFLHSFYNLFSVQCSRKKPNIKYYYVRIYRTLDLLVCCLFQVKMGSPASTVSNSQSNSRAIPPFASAPAVFLPVRPSMQVFRNECLMMLIARYLAITPALFTVFARINACCRRQLSKPILFCDFLEPLSEEANIRKAIVSSESPCYACSGPTFSERVFYKFLPFISLSLRTLRLTVLQPINYSAILQVLSHLRPPNLRSIMIRDFQQYRGTRALPLSCQQFSFEDVQLLIKTLPGLRNLVLGPDSIQWSDDEKHTALTAYPALKVNGEQYFPCTNSVQLLCEVCNLPARGFICRGCLHCITTNHPTCRKCEPAFGCEHYRFCSRCWPAGKVLFQITACMRCPKLLCYHCDFVTVYTAKSRYAEDWYYPRRCFQCDDSNYAANEMNDSYMIDMDSVARLVENRNGS